MECGENFGSVERVFWFCHCVLLLWYGCWFGIEGVDVVYSRTASITLGVSLTLSSSQTGYLAMADAMAASDRCCQATCATAPSFLSEWAPYLMSVLL